MTEPSLQLGGGNWAGKSGNLLAYHKANNNFYADDLTFARASTGTIVNADGLIEEVPYNLFQQSNTFDTTWTKSGGAIITSGQSGYDSTNDAWKIAPSTSVAAHYIFQNVINIGVTTISIYAKGGGFNYFSMRDNTSYAKFDLDLGVSATNGAGAISSTINSVGDGWYQCTFTYTKSVDGNVVFYINNTYDYVDSFAGDGASGVYFQDAQLNSGSTAKTYFPTTDRLNVPRIDYTGGGCGKLLLEPQRTNLVTYSEDVSQWTATNGTVNANAAISPDGTQNADEIIDSSGAYANFASNTNSFNSGDYTVSFFIKKKNTTTAWLGIEAAAGGDYLTFNSETGDVLFIGSDVFFNKKVESFNADWWKLSFTKNVSASTAVSLRIFPAISTNGSTLSSGATGTETIWGLQLEEGSYPTSYIPTSGATVTRLADAVSKTGISSLIGQTEGTVFIDFLSVNNFNGNFGILFEIKQDNNNRINIYFSNGTPRLFGVEDTISLFNQALSLTIGSTCKLGIKYNSTSTKVFIDGSLIHTLSGINNIAFSDFSITPNNNINYKNLQIYNTALTDQELINLTTI